VIVPVNWVGEVTPNPSRNMVTTEPAAAGFRHVLSEPSGLKASGNSPLTEAELRSRQVASCGDGVVSFKRNATGLAATIGSVRESDRFGCAAVKAIFACTAPAIANGAWKLICSGPA